MLFRERLEAVLMELGAKFGVRDTRGVLLMPELAHADLADMIGSSRPMVSRLIAEMTEEGLLLRQGKQFILLSALAGEKCDSGNQPKELSGSKVSPTSAPLPTVARALFKDSVAARNGKLPAAPVAPVSKRDPKGLSV
jgi:hypothetical protein